MSEKSCETAAFAEVARNLQAISECMKSARENHAGAAPTLVAVSKRQPDDRIEAALVAGHRVFGENRVQEAQERWAERRGLYPDLKLHLIGPLQTNKAADAVALFDVIEVVDRPKLARSLSTEMAHQGRHLPCRASASYRAAHTLSSAMKHQHMTQDNTNNTTQHNNKINLKSSTITG